MTNAGHSKAAQHRALTFPSRVDAWLVVTMAAAIALCLWQALLLQSIAALAAAVAVVVTIALFVVPCRYILAADRLVIRCGIRTINVPYRDIQRIEASRSMLAAPALSLQRLKITCARSVHLISPRDRERFMAELGTRAGIAGNFDIQQRQV